MSRLRCGSPEQPGVVPQLLDEVFALKGREQWRSEIHFEPRMVNDIGTF